MHTKPYYLRSRNHHLLRLCLFSNQLRQSMSNSSSLPDQSLEASKLRSSDLDLLALITVAPFVLLTSFCSFCICQFYDSLNSYQILQALVLPTTILDTDPANSPSRGYFFTYVLVLFPDRCVLLGNLSCSISCDLLS